MVFKRGEVTGSGIPLAVRVHSGKMRISELVKRVSKMTAAATNLGNCTVFTNAETTKEGIYCARCG